jgi:hypothetical protein
MTFRVWCLYSSFVHGGNSSQVGSKMQLVSECIAILQPIQSVKHMPQSPFRSILKKSRHIWFDVFIVHSSMIDRKRDTKTPVLWIRIESRICAQCESGSRALMTKNGTNFTVR